MSLRIEQPLFLIARDQVTKSSTPTPFRSQQAFMAHWSAAVERMHYLKVQHVEISDALKSLIRIRGSLRRPNLDLELIKPDVENLWLDIATRAEEACHAFEETERGFEFSFLAVVDKSYITGVISINRFANSQISTSKVHRAA